MYGEFRWQHVVMRTQGIDELFVSGSLITLQRIGQQEERDSQQTERYRSRRVAVITASSEGPDVHAGRLCMACDVRVNECSDCCV